MREKQRLSASVDAAVLAAAQAAVAEGRASNVSAWVNGALHRQAEHDGRLRSLDTFLQSYEARYGAITQGEIEDATRRARERAVVVRGKSTLRKKRRRGAKAA